MRTTYLWNYKAKTIAQNISRRIAKHIHESENFIVFILLKEGK